MSDQRAALRISVITPCLNSAHYVAEVIDSWAGLPSAHLNQSSEGF